MQPCHRNATRTIGQASGMENCHIASTEGLDRCHMIRGDEMSLASVKNGSFDNGQRCIRIRPGDQVDVDAWCSKPYARPSRYHRGLPAILYHTREPTLSIHQPHLLREQVYPLWKHNAIYNYHRMSRFTLSCSHIQQHIYLVHDCLVCQLNVPRYSLACLRLPRYELTP